ncbi:hypothetical protein EV424DRAFT_1543927 [Suillus variegatus]|nr:hypothetical protein EV424DRAFT_1543927 [Suillus variegatus]
MSALYLRPMKICPLHPMHHWGRTMRGKYVGTYTIPRPVEKLLKCMIVLNADLRFTARQAMADVYRQVAGAVPGKLVRKKSASAAVREAVAHPYTLSSFTSPPAKDTSTIKYAIPRDAPVFCGVLTFRSLVSNSCSPSHSSVSRSVSRTPEKEIQEDTCVNERHHTRSKSEDAHTASAECNLPSGMRRARAVEEMLQNLAFASTSITLPPALLLSPLISCFSFQALNANMSRSSSRLPRRMLAANEIFEQLVSGYSISPDDSGFTQRAGVLTINVPAQTPRCQCRATILTCLPKADENIMDGLGSPSNFNRREKSWSQGNLDSHIRPIDKLEFDLMRGGFSASQACLRIGPI